MLKARINQALTLRQQLMDLLLLQSQELAKLQAIAKHKERAQEANQRIQELNESFSKETERRLSDRMETMAENKNAQVKALQDRLKEHVSYVHCWDWADGNPEVELIQWCCLELH